MAVVGSAREMADSPKGGLGWKGQNFERYFRVEVDSFDDGPQTVLAATGLPSRGDTYQTDNEEDNFAICKDLQAARLGTTLYFRVTVKYESLETSAKALTVAEEIAAWEDPLEETPFVQIRNEIYKEPVYGIIDPDLNLEDPTQPIVNSAGDIFSPPFMRDNSRMIITISRNEDINDETLIISRSFQFQNTINDQQWWFAPKHAAKMQPFSIEKQSRSKGPTGELFVYLRVTYTIHVQFPDWDVRPLDYGANYLDTNDKLTPFKAKAHPYKGLLDGSGSPLTGVDDAGVPNPVAPGVQSVFLGPLQIYPESSFNDLELPQSLSGDF